MSQQCFVNSNEGVTVNPNMEFILYGVCDTNCHYPVLAQWQMAYVDANDDMISVSEQYYESIFCFIISIIG